MPLLDDIATFLDAQSTAFTLLSGTAGDLGKQIMLDHSAVSDTITYPITNTIAWSGEGPFWLISSIDGRWHPMLQVPTLMGQ